MISVVIPCYNGASFIQETLASILEQQVGSLEIIIVDDGSTDKSAEVIKRFNAPQVTYIYQENKGVSAARNKGLSVAKGDFIIFFDADDKMSEGFLEKRKRELEADAAIDFCCGPVLTFPEKSETTYGTSENVAEDLLTYKPQFSSCPSNYLIRKTVLLQHQIFFNEKLSSTADRFFLIELAAKTKGKLINEAPLYYRVSPGSMSNKLSNSLMLDNEMYFNLLKEKKLVPNSVRKNFNFKISYILGLGFIRTGSYAKGAKYISQAFFQNPKRLMSNLISKL